MQARVVTLYVVDGTGLLICSWCPQEGHLPPFWRIHTTGPSRPKKGTKKKGQVVTSQELGRSPPPSGAFAVRSFRALFKFADECWFFRKDPLYVYEILFIQQNQLDLCHLDYVICQYIKQTHFATLMTLECVVLRKLTLKSQIEICKQDLGDFVK